MEFSTSVFNPFLREHKLLERVRNDCTSELFMWHTKVGIWQHFKRGRKRQVNRLTFSMKQKEEADLRMPFKILSKKIAIEPIEFFDAPLTSSRGGRLRLYPKVTRSRVRSIFLNYQNLKHLILLIVESGALVTCLWLSLNIF